MSVVIKESVCRDCSKVDTCMKLKRLGTGKTIRDELLEVRGKAAGGKDFLYKLVEERKRPPEVFEVVIKKCGVMIQNKEYVRMKKRLEEKTKKSETEDDDKLYYCDLCKAMHRNGSDIGKAHKDLSI